MAKTYVAIGKESLCYKLKSDIDFCSKEYFGIGVVKTSKDVKQMKKTLGLSHALRAVHKIVSANGPYSGSLKVMTDCATRLAIICDGRVTSSSFVEASTQVIVSLASLADSCDSGFGAKIIQAYFDTFVVIYRQSGLGSCKQTPNALIQKCTINKQNEDEKAPWARIYLTIKVYRYRVYVNGNDYSNGNDNGNGHRRHDG